MLSNDHRLDRRHFMKHVAGATAMTMGGANLLSNLHAAAPAMKKQGKHFIMLYMGGGPTHMDLWNIHAGSPNQGSFEPLKTSANGVSISEAMPKVAEQFKHLIKIDSLNSQEGDHGRGRFRLTHAFPPSTLGVNVPSVNSIISHFCGNPEFPLLSCTIGGGGGEAGFLGNAYAAFACNNPGTVPENISMPAMGDERTTTARGERRAGLLSVLENNFKSFTAPHLTKKEDRKAYSDAAEQHSELVGKALDISLKAGKKMFEFDAKDNDLLDKKYGKTGFGRGCLLARKLVESGVSVVEVNLGGWDMHANVAAGVKQRGSGELDPGMGALVEDLVQRGLWKDTVVLWCGDFGRTPRINQGAGRDHWGNGWSVVLGGGGLKGGQSYGETDKDGMSIKDKPVLVGQLYATIYTALGINLNDRNLDLHDNLGRRYYLTGDKENMQPISEIMS
jgi:uncharacterized protein (DUF1501 family)